MPSVDLFYYLSSPYCRSVLMLADTIGLQLNYLELDKSRPDHLKAELLAVNPQHTVPTIIDNGFSVWESRAILTYLAEKYDKTNSLYPKDIQKRASINQKLFFDFELSQKVFAYFYPLISGGTPDPEKLQKVVGALDFLNAELEGKAFATGDEVTVADIALITNLTMIELLKVDFKSFKNLETYIENCKKSISGYSKMAQQSFEKSIAFVEQVINKE